MISKGNRDLELQILAAARTVSSRSEALGLLQGYPFTGFSKFSEGTIAVAPAHRRLCPDGIRWDLFWDARIFGEKGEVHFWKLASGQWRHRFEATREAGDQDVIHRAFPVWGYPSEVSEEGWVLFREHRGVEVWIPPEYGEAHELALEVDCILGETSERSGIISVVDSMIRRLKPSADGIA